MSSKWRQIRKKKAIEQNNTCEICGKVILKGFHIHHKTYKNFGNEDLSELMFLCENCHKQLHKKLKKKTVLKSVDCAYAEQYILKGNKKKRLIYCLRDNTKCNGLCKKYKKQKLKNSKRKSIILKILCKTLDKDKI